VRFVYDRVYQSGKEKVRKLIDSGCRFLRFHRFLPWLHGEKEKGQESRRARKRVKKAWSLHARHSIIFHRRYSTTTTFRQRKTRRWRRVTLVEASPLIDYISLSVYIFQRHLLDQFHGWIRVRSARATVVSNSCSPHNLLWHLLSVVLRCRSRRRLIPNIVARLVVSSSSHLRPRQSVVPICGDLINGL